MFATLSVLALAAVACQAAPAGDKITSLPDFDKSFPSPQYSGYLDIPALTASGQKHIHYWLAESDKGANSPVVFWLNGGPGCSSMGGYWEEQGDLHFNNFRKESSGIEVNPYRWSRFAHVVFVEHPAGVGFSWADNEAAYHSNDTVSARDMVNTMGAFFDAFPEYASNDVWLTGESYAGIYVPTTAYQLYINNNRAGSHQLNFKGVMVGNGCIGTEVGGCSDAEGSVISYDYFNAHALISHDLYERIEKACGDFTKISAECDALMLKASDQIGDVNIYDIYGKCEPYEQDDDDVIGDTAHKWRTPGNAAARTLRGPDSCFDNDDAKTNYLNRADVQAAIHVKNPGWPWRDCGGALKYDRTEADLTKKVWPALINNYRCLVYNGDADACVPYIGTEAWTSRVGGSISSVTRDWHPWMVNGQVAGYATKYATNNFTFATVKGAGHMVPEFQPEAALAMFQRFLDGDDL